MKANSLAFRLFATAAAGCCWCCRSPAAIIYSLYRHEVDDQLRPRASRCCSPSSSATPIEHARGPSPARPRTVGEALFEITHSGWYWQIKPLDGKPGSHAALALARRRRPAAAERARRRAQRASEVRWANLDGPAAADGCASPRPVYVFGEGKTAQRYSVAVAGKLSEVEDSLAAFRAQLIHGAGARRHRPARRHAVPDPLRPVPAGQGRAGPRRHPLRRGDAGSTATCRSRSSRCSRSSTRCSSPTRRSSSAPAPTSATSRTP